MGEPCSSPAESSLQPPCPGASAAVSVAETRPVTKGLCQGRSKRTCASEFGTQGHSDVSSDVGGGRAFAYLFCVFERNHQFVEQEHIRAALPARRYSANPPNARPRGGRDALPFVGDRVKADSVGGGWSGGLQCRCPVACPSLSTVFILSLFSHPRAGSLLGWSAPSL